HPASRHVLAAVVTHALDDRVRARVADGEALGGDSAEVRLARDGAVEDDVSDEDVLLRHEGALLRRVDDDAPAGEALADVVVRVSLELERHALGEPSAEALAGRPIELEVDRVGREELLAVALRDLVAERGTDGAVDVHDGKLGAQRRARLERALRELDETVV